MSSSTLVDLLAPNLNRDKMLYKAQAERDAQKKGANDRRERDRLALEKQRSVVRTRVAVNGRMNWVGGFSTGRGNGVELGWG